MANPQVSKQEIFRTRPNHPMGPGLDCYYLTTRDGYKYQLVKEVNGIWRLVILHGLGPDLRLVFEKIMDIEQAKAYAAGYGIDLEPEQLDLFQ